MSRSGFAHKMVAVADVALVRTVWSSQVKSGLVGVCACEFCIPFTAITHSRHGNAKPLQSFTGALDDDARRGACGAPRGAPGGGSERRA